MVVPVMIISPLRCNVPNCDGRRIWRGAALKLVLCLAWLLAQPRCAVGQLPTDLYAPGRSFALHDKIVSTSFFIWYQSFAGQLNGPWEPEGGRITWTGEVPYWKNQIKQVMAANIDVINVHLFEGHGFTQQRRNLFQALGELRQEGYDVPKVTPFLDPIITWGTSQSIDVATLEGKNLFVAPYQQFFYDYFQVNTDPYADSYLTRINNRTVLDTWHVHLSLKNQNAISREDIRVRLQSTFGEDHPIFNDNIYMIGTAISPQLSFVDEKVIQFETQQYFDSRTYNSLKTVQLKPGYWDQNIRDPGYFLPRAGGTHYGNAWNQINADSAIDRVYVESWNEYDEGSGIYAAEAQAPQVINPPNDSGNTDVWSNTGDQFEYIKTTAEGAREFNDVPDLGASILWQNLPNTMYAGETFTAQIVVRNDGDLSWSEANLFRLGQNENLDPVLFSSGRTVIDDLTNEIPVYGGVFRGRPFAFDVELTAPNTPGQYETHWQMLQEGNVWFGEELTHTFTVLAPGDFDADGDVDGEDFLVWQRGESPRPFDPDDLADWESNYGRQGASLAAGTAVPEPASLLLLICVVTLLCVTRPQRNQRLVQRPLRLLLWQPQSAA
jgi:hypothetical protein